MIKLILLLLLPILVNAEFYLNGFGSLTFSNTDSKKREHSIFLDQKKSINNSINIESGSLFGLQGTMKHDYFTVVGQTMFRETLEKEFREPQLEWLFLKTDITNNLKIFLGRLRIPIYLHSKNLYVDYSRDYAKLPVELYLATPFSHYDGVEVSYYYNINDSFMLKLLFGYSKTGSSNPLEEPGVNNNLIDVTSENMKLLSVTLDGDDFSFRATYINIQLSLIRDENISPAQFMQLAQVFKLSMLDLFQIKDILEEYNVKDKNSDAYTLAFEYYFQNTIFTAEFLRSISESFTIPDIESYYISLSHIINNDFTSFFYYSQLKSIQNTNPKVSGYSENIQNLIHGLGLSNNKNNDEYTIAIGLKYHINDNINLKSEIKRRRMDIINEDFNVYHLSLDFMF